MFLRKVNGVFALAVVGGNGVNLATAALMVTGVRPKDDEQVDSHAELLIWT